MTPRTAERRQQARLRRKARRAQERQERLRREEAAAEQLAPAIQRRAVNGFRGPRVTIANGHIEVASTVRNLAQRQSKRARSGGEPAITLEHVRASERLLIAWRTVSQGVSIGRDYEQMGAGRSTNYGVPTDGKHRKLLVQVKLREELRDALEALGPLQTVVRRTVLDGVDLSVWAAEARMDRTAALGFLAAALTMLVSFYAARA